MHHDDREPLQATFRLRRSYRDMGAGGVLGFLVLGVVGVYASLTDPEVPHPVALAAFMGGGALAAVGLFGWILASYYRERLTIQGDRVTARGVFWSDEFDLKAVTEARWQAGSELGCVLLRTANGRHSIQFSNYEREESERIVDHLRCVIAPEIQKGWNLYAYRRERLGRRAGVDKPGPDEIVLKRSRWDRYLVPGVLAGAVVGVFGWWMTGELQYFTATLAPVAGWLVIRFSTPKEGMLAHKLSASSNADVNRMYLVFLAWGVVSLGGLAALSALQKRFAHPDAVMILWGVLAAFVLFFEVWRCDRRESRREQEAADLAAKERGETQNLSDFEMQRDHWSM